MSYILEALKKAEEKRKQEESPSVLHQSQPKPPHYRRERAPRPLWFMVILIIPLLLLGGWYFIRENWPVPEASVPKLQTLQAPVIETPTDNTQESPSPQSLPELAPRKEKIAITAKATKGEKDTILQPEPLTPQQSAGAIAQSSQDTSAAKNIKVPYLEELPVELQNAFPAFHLAGHVYSPDPGSRLVIINNNIVREGDIIEKDFILDEITIDGVILKKGDISFQLWARQ